MKFGAINLSWDALIIQICYMGSNIPTYELNYDFIRFLNQRNDGEWGRGWGWMEAVKGLSL